MDSQNLLLEGYHKTHGAKKIENLKPNCWAPNWTSTLEVYQVGAQFSVELQLGTPGSGATQLWGPQLEVGKGGGPMQLIHQ